ncbi:MAG: cobyrinate a,c-diamide synthase [Jhaorihella sp.]
MSARPRFMISAAHKSSGKTVVSTGLAAAFRAAGEDIRTFKKGPDYIDPMWLAAASGRACYNLDFNTMPRETIAPFLAARAGAGRGALSLIEANKGLYDGVCADGSDSNAELAKLLGLPVVLVIDTLGMTRGIAPLLTGYRAFDSEVNIAGLILNRVGGARHEGKLRRAVETYSDIPLIGSVWRDARLDIGERHLGLTTPAESEGMATMIAGFGEIIAQSVDLDRLRRIAATAPGLEAPDAHVSRTPQWPGLRIGILRDAAFGFYYPDDLEAMQAEGAQLIPIDATCDSGLPFLDGLFIGGGFPEMRMRELSANTALRAAIGDALRAGLPCYAECGGLMYLCESLSWNGVTMPMVGLIPGRARMHDRPQGRGYVEFTSTQDCPWQAGDLPVKAHEFHYASIEGLPSDTVFARDMRRGTGTDGRRDGIVTHNTVAGFCHLRNTAAAPWVPAFLDFVARTATGSAMRRRQNL